MNKIEQKNLVNLDKMFGIVGWNPDTKYYEKIRILAEEMDTNNIVIKFKEIDRFGETGFEKEEIEMFELEKEEVDIILKLCRTFKEKREMEDANLD